MRDNPTPIRPFSGPGYVRNSETCGPHMPCAYCGKPIKQPKWWTEVIDGGAKFDPGDGTADQNDPGYMGEFPVGHTCRAYLKKRGVRIFAR